MSKSQSTSVPRLMLHLFANLWLEVRRRSMVVNLGGAGCGQYGLDAIGHRHGMLLHPRRWPDADTEPQSRRWKWVIGHSKEKPGLACLDGSHVAQRGEGSGVRAASQRL